MATDQKKNIINDAILKNIHDSIRHLRTGLVQIRVRDSKIIRIDTTEQQQFDEIWIEEGSGI